MFLFNPEPVHLGLQVSGNQEMQPLGDQSLHPSFSHQLIEQNPKTYCPQTRLATAQGGVIRGKLSSAQTRKPLAGRVKSNLLFYLLIRAILEGLQEDHYVPE